MAPAWRPDALVVALHDAIQIAQLVSGESRRKVWDLDGKLLGIHGNFQDLMGIYMDD